MKKTLMLVVLMFLLASVSFAAQNWPEVKPKIKKECQKYDLAIGNEYSINGKYDGPANSSSYSKLNNTEVIDFNDTEGCTLEFYIKNMPSDKIQIKMADRVDIKVRLEEPVISSNRSVGQYISGYLCEYVSFGEEFIKQNEAEKVSRENKQIQEANEKKNYINKLVQKWSSSGPPKDFLGSQFQTYAGSGMTGNVATLVELLDRLDGKIKWTKKENLWILEQSVSDNVTGRNHKYQWAFYDLRNEKGFILLDRIVIDGKDFPRPQLYGIVMKVMQ